MRIVESLAVFFFLAVVCQAKGGGKMCGYKTTKVPVPAINNEGCRIVIVNPRRETIFPNTAPLLLKPGRDVTHDGYGFYLPSDSSGEIVLARGDVIRMACPGSENSFKNMVPAMHGARAVCVRGTTFKIGDEDFTIKELFCEDYPAFTVRRSKQKCFKNAIMFEVGFVDGQDFYKIIDICFDDAERNNLWSKFQLVPGIGGNQRQIPRPAFVSTEEVYRDLDLPYLYNRTNQRHTISSILDSEELGLKYVPDDPKTCTFLSRGHMAAKGDFVYAFEQRATFLYINTAPQWQDCNGGNWAKIENALWTFNADKKLNLIVYTGTYGVMTLPNEANKMKEIWLSLDENNNKAVPVPELFWKVVYQESTKKAIALLTVNNPHIKNPDRICVDVCNRVTWLTWAPNEQKDVKKGFSYCCEVAEEFRSAVKTLPFFQVAGILTG